MLHSSSNFLQISPAKLTNLFMTLVITNKNLLSKFRKLIYNSNFDINNKYYFLLIYLKSPLNYHKNNNGLLHLRKMS